MPLIHLPDDILFNVLNLLSPPDILLLRKTCKRLQALTTERTVWTNVYRNPEYFLQPGPPDSQTVPDLERVILHAHRWATVWTDFNTLRERRPRFSTINLPDTRYLAEYQGQYLAIGTATSLILYDLHVEKIIYRYEISTQPFWLYIHSNTKDNDAAFYIPFARVLRNDASTLQLCICKVDSSGNASIDEIAGIQISRNCITGIGYDFFLAQGESGDISLLYIPSQKLYTISAGTPVQQLTNVIFTPGYVLLIFTEYSNTVERKYLELYPLPDPMVIEIGTHILPLHCGTLSMHFSEASFFSTDLSVDGNEIIWLVVLAGPQLWTLRISLQPDGTMDFHKPHYDTHHLPERTLAHAFDLRFTASSNSSRGRGIARVATPKLSGWLTFDVRRSVDGNVSIARTIVDKDILPSLLMYDFDAYQGLLCGVNDDDEVIVLKLVQ
ncbi:hypothetical protein F5890DRAFT_1502696 [Lentinula detonsa]|uniref:F-box domain-containing protein n=1 Tax=Lentinula detonsa TaxID=2804962 RepID=A0AA38Q3C6_9AGAR|nr:hypothetical protein F5890DRAFT_1502696 [Lentinula detonsa]